MHIIGVVADRQERERIEAVAQVAALTDLIGRHLARALDGSAPT